MEHLRGLYKNKVQFGQVVQDQRRNVVEGQKKKREASFFHQRHKSIVEDPVASPVPPQPPVKSSRLEKLLKWKAEKEKVVQQQKLQKRPPFKVGLYHPPIGPAVVDVNVKSTSVKCSTQKKAAAATRAEASSRVNRQVSSAAASLAALSAPQDTGRVTRSRAKAAVAEQHSSSASVCKQKPVASTSSARTQTAASKSKLPPSKPASYKPIRGSSKTVTTAQNSTRKRLPQEAKSFAPTNHQFKAPASLTLPITPLALKRKQKVHKSVAWPKIAGVDLLRSPDAQAPSTNSKAFTSTKCLRRGSLAFDVKAEEEFSSSETAGCTSNSPKAGVSTRSQIGPWPLVISKEPAPSKTTGTSSKTPSAGPSARSQRGTLASSKEPASSETTGSTSKTPNAGPSERSLRRRTVALASETEKTSETTGNTSKTPNAGPSERSLRRRTVALALEKEEEPSGSGTGTTARTPKMKKPTPKPIRENETSHTPNTAKKLPPAKFGSSKRLYEKHTPVSTNTSQLLAKSEVTHAENNKMGTPSTTVFQVEEVELTVQSSRSLRSGSSSSKSKLNVQQLPVYAQSVDVEESDSRSTHADSTTMIDSIPLQATVSKSVTPQNLNKTIEVSAKREIRCKGKLVRHVVPDPYPSPASRNRKSRSSTSGKENVPFAKNVEELNHEAAGMGPKSDPIQMKSSRMSIHEPSPPVSTPQKLPGGMVPAQFSPYITTARGRNRHSLRRDSLNTSGPVLPESILKTKQIEGFRKAVECETNRLLRLCQEWDELLPEVPSSRQDEILGAVGQARLLSKDKFQQFRNLITKFEDENSEDIITADDLTGFWEMIMVTVEGLNDRFSKLDQLKANCWEDPQKEDKPMEIKPRIKTSKTFKLVNKQSSQTTSRLKDMIKAEREKKRLAEQGDIVCNKADTTTFSGGFFMIESPQKVVAIAGANSTNCTPTKITPGRCTRRSLLQQVLTNSAARSQSEPSTSVHSPSSPTVQGVVAQMRASLKGRRISTSEESFSTPPASLPITNTHPTKSILKSRQGQSVIASDSIQRNKVVFCVSPNPLSPMVLSNNSISVIPKAETPNTFSSEMISKGRRRSLIPRRTGSPITSCPVLSSPPASVGRRPSLLPVRESLAPSKTFPSGDLIEWDTPPSSKS